MTDVIAQMVRRRTRDPSIEGSNPHFAIRKRFMYRIFFLSRAREEVALTYHVGRGRGGQSVEKLKNGLLEITYEEKERHMQVYSEKDLIKRPCY